MPTSLPNLNFLAPLVLEIWRDYSQNKKWGCWSSQTPLSAIGDKIFHWVLVPVQTYRRTKFQRSISFFSTANLHGVFDYGDLKDSVHEWFRQPEVAIWPPKTEILISLELWETASKFERQTLGFRSGQVQKVSPNNCDIALQPEIAI